MHMILTGENITAQEAAAAGFVAKVFDVDETVPRAIAYAQQMASFSAPVVAMAKEAVNAGEYMFFFRVREGGWCLQLNVRVGSRRFGTEGWVAF